VVILLREVDLYAGLIESVFSDYGIPFFLDHKRTVLHHPLVELIRAALETVAGDWSYDPVFRYLKTDLAPVSREEVDKLENYVLAHGIRGGRWIEDRPWDYRRRLTLEEDIETTEAEKRVLDEINRQSNCSFSVPAIQESRRQRSTNNNRIGLTFLLGCGTASTAGKG